MRNCIITSLLIFLSSFFAVGQVIHIEKGEKEKVSGFLGLRNIVQAKGMFAVSNQPQKSIPNQNNYAYSGLSINREFELNLDRVITNRKSLGLVLGMSSTGMQFRESENRVHLNGGILDYILSTPSVKDNYFGIKYKIYTRRKGGISPVGRYWALNCNLHKYTIDMTSLLFWTTKEDYSSSYNYIKTVYKLEEPVHKYTLVELGFSAGMNRIIARRIMLDYGVHFGFVQSGRLLLSLSDNTYTGELEADLYIKDEILARLSKYHIMKFYFSAGYIF